MNGRARLSSDGSVKDGVWTSENVVFMKVTLEVEDFEEVE